MPEAIVNPMPGKHPPSVGLRCVMVANQPDIDNLSHSGNAKKPASRKVMMSRLTWEHAHFKAGIMGPFIGAPYAAMLLENLIAWGVREVIFFGWCGAVSPHVHIGDIILPDAAFIDDGTSESYITGDSSVVAPSVAVQSRLKAACQKQSLPFYEGPVWSTDAIYRETREKALHYQALSALAVEMEAAALFAVGAFRGIDVGCVLVVSDELSSLSWKPGFSDPRFIEGRGRACGLLQDLWAQCAG